MSDDESFDDNNNDGSGSSSTPKQKLFDDEYITKKSIRDMLAAANPAQVYTSSSIAAMTKVAELMILKLSAGARENTDKTVVLYDDVQNFVAENNQKCIVILKDLFPPKVRFSDIKQRVFGNEHND